MNTLETIKEKCIECPLCQKECRFLKKYGTPKYIAETHTIPRTAGSSPCLLNAASAVFAGQSARWILTRKTMFLEMRREAVRKGVAPFPEHKALINYEKRATSKQYSYYALPDGCDTIFSPGCNIFEK
ncbi:MAG: hypothetical protein ABIJ52_13095 [Pseudomonadota bacterium]